MDFGTNRRVPIWFWGALFAVILIILSRGSLGFGNRQLTQQFALQPTPVGISIPLPNLTLGELPPALQDAAKSLWDQLGIGGNTTPLEPEARTNRLLIQIKELRRSEAGLQVIGVVTNISTGEIQVPISAFELRDSTGASYIAGGGASAMLKPGENTPLELTVPLPEDRGLMLITSLAPDPPVEQRLLVVSP